MVLFLSSASLMTNGKKKHSKVVLSKIKINEPDLLSRISSFSSLWSRPKIQANSNISINQGSGIRLYIQRIALLKLDVSKTALAELDSFELCLVRLVSLYVVVVGAKPKPFADTAGEGKLIRKVIANGLWKPGSMTCGAVLFEFISPQTGHDGETIRRPASSACAPHPIHKFP